MIKNATASTDEKVDSTTERPCLIIDINSTIDSQGFKLILMMLEFLQLVLNLDGELSRRAENDRLNFALA